tara:strand:- start:653 stop:766 length:114 start_codon:yes stop_codon:yes gene_type:complete
MPGKLSTKINNNPKIEIIIPILKIILPIILKIYVNLI